MSYNKDEASQNILKLSFVDEGSGYYYKENCLTSNGKNSLGCYIRLWRDEIDVYAVYSKNTDDKEIIFRGKLKYNSDLFIILDRVGFNFYNINLLQRK